jgi:hypothetical protein
MALSGFMSAHSSWPGILRLREGDLSGHILKQLPQKEQFWLERKEKGPW